MSRGKCKKEKGIGFNLVWMKENVESKVIGVLPDKEY